MYVLCESDIPMRSQTDSFAPIERTPLCSSHAALPLGYDQHDVALCYLLFASAYATNFSAVSVGDRADQPIEITTIIEYMHNKKGTN